MLRIDSYFTNGKVNKVCQDYVIHGETPVPYVILCDGCSSSKFTDVGARILAHSAKEALNVLRPYYSERLRWDTDEEQWDNFGQSAIIFSSQAIKHLGLPSECLDSTLMVLFHIESLNILRCFIYGDGSIIFIKNNEPDMIYTYSFEGNAPYYLSYRVDTERRNLYAKFAENFNSTIKKRKQSHLFKEFSYANSSGLYHHYELIDIPLNDYNGALISSDGISSFVNHETTDRLSIENITKEFTSFKNYNGEFIKRRIKRAVEDLGKQQIYNTDDIGVGGIIFNG